MHCGSASPRITTPLCPPGAGIGARTSSIALHGTVSRVVGIRSSWASTLPLQVRRNRMQWPELCGANGDGNPGRSAE